MTWLEKSREILSLVPWYRRLFVVGGLFLSSFFELLGLSMIVPLLAMAGDIRQPKGLTLAVKNGLTALGLPFDPMLLLAFIIIGLSLKAAFTIGVMHYVSKIVSSVSRGFQKALIRGLLRAQWGYFVRQPLGRLTHAAGAESAAAGECFISIANILAFLIQAALYFVVIALLSWPLAITAVVTCCIMFISFGKLIRKSREAARAHRHQMRSMAASFTDAMIGIKPLRAMGRTERFTELFEAEARAAKRSQRQRILSSEYVTELQEPFLGAVIAIGFYFAMRDNALAGHEVLIIALIFVRFVMTLGPMQRTIQRFVQSFDQYVSLQEMLTDIDSAVEHSPGTRQPEFDSAIALREVSFRHGRKEVLRDISLMIRRGAITTLAGPSGVGKSTIIDLIVGLYQPDAGGIFVDDVDLREIDLKRWRRMIGYVPQEVTLFHDSVFQNVSLWEENVTDEEVIAALRLAGAWEFVQEMPNGLDHIVGERGNRLSGGQRQRISIARALLHRPRVLILDEATTGLDPATEQEICAHVQQLCRREGLTVLAVSHQAAWQGVADHVYMLSDGATAQLLPPPAPVPTLAVANG